MAISVTKPLVGGNQDSWGTLINAGLDTIVDTLNGTSGTVAPDLSTLTMNGVNVTATAADLNTLDGVTATTDELNTLDGVTATTAEINTLDGVDTSGTGFGFVPSNGIIMWHGAIADIPTGWFLCDGSNSTPDLRNRFVVGAGSDYAVDATGGSDSVTLTTANLPAHTHSSGTLGGTTNTTGAHSHTHGRAGPVGGGGYGERFGSYIQTSTTSVNGAHSHTVDVNSGSTGSAGSGEEINIVPKYYALAYIMKA